MHSLHLGFVHPLHDVALHQCLPLPSVWCLPVPGGSPLPCYVLLPSYAWSSCWSLPSSWLPLCAAFGPPIVLHSCCVWPISTFVSIRFTPENDIKWKLYLLVYLIAFDRESTYCSINTSLMLFHLSIMCLEEDRKGFLSILVFESINIHKIRSSVYLYLSRNDLKSVVCFCLSRVEGVHTVSSAYTSRVTAPWWWKEWRVPCSLSPCKTLAN